MASGRRSWASLARVAVVVIALAAVPAPAGAAPEDDLEAAQARANRAAEELAQAEEEMARTQDGVAHLQTRVDNIDARVGLAREQVRQLAIRMYVEGTVPVIRILRMGDANEVVRAQQYSHVITGGSTDALRQFRVDRDDLREELTALERQREAHADSLENLDRRRAGAIEEIDRLGQVVAEARAAREAERRQAEASAAVSASSSGSSSSEGSAAAAAAAGSPDPSGTSAPSPVGPVLPDQPAVAPEWYCPVQGPLAFSNDYGAPRGGGSSHQGNDILAPRGTPVAASVDGEVRHRSGAVSGLAFYLDGDDGNEYFGAHLDSYGESGRVSAGTVIGTVGNTGDASSTAPHLHFEIHPGGNGNVNPFSMLSRYC